MVKNKVTPPINYIRVILIALLLFIPMVSADKVMYRVRNAGTNSMSPTFNGTSKLFIEVMFKDDVLELNHIYCYRPQFEWNPYDYSRQVRWCHRYIDDHNGKLVFKGDNAIDYELVERKYIEWEIVKII